MGKRETTTVELLVRKIHQWVEKNAERESIFSTPYPEFFVWAVPLLDFVYETSGVPKPENNEK
jgi:hypothetical protein